MNIALLKKGDQKTFRELIKATHGDIYKLALKFTSDSNDAKDITQEVYLEAYNNIHKFREDSGIKTWLYRITVNRSLNMIKRNKTKFDSVSIDENFGEAKNIFLSSQYEADKPLENKELKFLLNDALSKIPEKQRVSFLLFNHDGLTYKEIAEILNISHSAVESLIFRAKANLRKILGDYYKNNYKSAQVFKTNNVK